MHKSATMESLHEMGRQRDESIRRATHQKIEQDRARQLVATVSAEAKARERDEKARRVSLERAKQQQDYAKVNAQQNERRQHMLGRVAVHEAEVRSRLAEEIVAHDVAGRLRKRALAEARDRTLAVKAEATTQSVRRAQSAKLSREADVFAQRKAEAALREDARDVRVQKARAAKERERLEIVKRNMDDEARREKALRSVHERDAQQHVKLASEVVNAEAVSRRRLSGAAAHRLKEVAELSQARQLQQARAVEARVRREHAHREAALQAAVVKHREREAKAQRAAQLKESQRLYYAQRNALHDAKYEQRSMDAFAMEMAAQMEGMEQHGPAAAERLGLSRTSSATILQYVGGGAGPSLAASL